MFTKLLQLIGSIVISLTAGLVGSFSTIPNIPSWYANLDKPFFSPPNWLFGPVWTTLYILMGIALFLVIRASTRKQSKRDAYTIFGIQLVLNALWPVAFFGLRMPEAGIAVILLLLVAVIVTIIKFKRFSRYAALLLLPYLAWVSFATCLNVAIAVLN